MRIANVLIAASLATMLASPVLAKLPAPTDAEKAAAAEAAANLVRVDIRLRKETPVMTDTRASL